MNDSTQTHTAEIDALIGNPGPPPDWPYPMDAEDRAALSGPVPSLTLPCGCHVRRPDYEAVLCAEHLAEMNGSTRVIPPEVGQ